MKTVGTLAAGWNKAAGALGYCPPQWIARHGSGRGDFQIDVSATEISITLSNNVPYAGRVKGLGRSIETAADWERERLEKQVVSYLERSAAAAGFTTQGAN